MARSLRRIPAEPAGDRGGRRAVLDEARRRVERALMIAPAAGELAAAAEAVLAAADAGELVAAGEEVRALEAALARYRLAAGD